MSSVCRRIALDKLSFCQHIRPLDYPKAQMPEILSQVIHHCAGSFALICLTMRVSPRPPFVHPVLFEVLSPSSRGEDDVMLIYCGISVSQHLTAAWALDGTVGSEPPAPPEDMLCLLLFDCIGVPSYVFRNFITENTFLDTKMSF